MKQETVNKILSQTESGYDLISGKFSQTRKHFWRGLEFIKDYSHDGGKILDYGCGNGRLLELIGDRDIEYYGADVSQGLIDLATESYSAVNIEFSKLDPIQTTLPFDDVFFNTVYSIAVFHHFPSKKYRSSIANELYNKTKSGGYVVITVWYLWQKKYLKNILKNWKNKIFKMLIRMSGIRSAGSLNDSVVKNLDWNDCLITFTDNDGKKFERFHHAFTKGELKVLFEKAGFEIEKCEIPDGRNIVLVGRKK